MGLTVAKLFQDNMILQREKPLRIWGEAAPGSSIEVSIQGNTGKTVSREDGTWEVTLPPLKASVLETLEICCGEEQIVLRNVAVGEVWLAGGQSNMEFHMFYDQDYEAFLTICEDPLIRFYDVPKVASEEHEKRFDYSLQGFWRSTDAENLKYFSAAGYYFARALRADLGVPVGIIGCNWGGSRSVCWMDRETARKYGPVWLEDYEKGLKDIPDLAAAEGAYYQNPAADPKNIFDIEFRNHMMKGATLEELDAFFGQLGEGGFGNYIGPWHEWRPNGLYEYMLKKVMPYTLRGVIYYQGESDEDHPEIYANMLEGMIGCWRKGFQDELPFLMTQLAPLAEVLGQGGKYYPILRQQQDLAADKLEQVWCASIGDVGHYYDIHPKQKRQVGERLALLARGHVYGEDILCDAPKGVNLERKGDALVITCEHSQGGLAIMEDLQVPVQVYDASGTQLSQDVLQVSVNQDQIVIHVKGGLPKGSCRVEFAQTSYYNVNICNMAGIPVKPFCLLEKLTV